MTQTLPTTALDLIEYILSEFHEKHRHDLPELIGLAQSLPASPDSPSFAEELQGLMDELEAHMFKEEMRLFPMMEQGGNTLMQLLVDDMMQEHVRHGVDTAAMTARLNALVVPQAQQATLAQVKVGWQAFLVELAKHVAAEDDALFLMFQPVSPA